MIEQIVESLVTEWGFDVDNESVDDFSNALGSFTKIAAGVTVVASAAAAAIAWVVDSTAKNIDAQAKASASFGISAQEYKELTHAAKLSGVEQESLFDVMKDLTKNTFEAANGNVALAATFRLLDIDAKEFAKLPMSEKLAVLADRLKEIPDAGKRSVIAMRLMGEQGVKMASLLGGGGDEIRRMIEEAKLFSPPITKEDEQNAATYNDNMLKMTTVSKGFFQVIGTKVIPIVNKFTNRLLKFYLANKKVIDSGLKKFAELIAAAFEKSYKSAVFFYNKARDVIDIIGGLENAAFLLGLTMAILIPAAAIFGIISFVRVIQTAIAVMKILRINTMLANASFFLIPLAIAAVVAILALLATDVEAFLNGQDSFIGRAAAKWPKFGEAIQNVLPYIKALRKFFGFFREEAIKDLAWLIDAFMNFGTNLEVIGNFISRVFSFASRSMKKAFLDAIVYILEKAQGALGIISSIASSIPGIDSDTFEGIGINDAIVQLKADSVAQNAAPPSSGGTSIGSVKNETTIIQQPGQNTEDMRAMVQEENTKFLDQMGRAIKSNTDPGIK